MQKFLFITCLTPSSHLSDLRRELHKHYLDALGSQTAKNWTAFLLGEEEKIEGQLNYIKCISQTKEDKLLEAEEKLKQMVQKPEYIIRLDDDDHISENALMIVEQLKENHNVFTDRYQHMFDTYSGKSLVKTYPWWPSTIIMKYEDAMCPQQEFDNKALFTCPHDLSFHKYYKNKKVYYFDKHEPLYIRVFSPTSKSFNLFNKNFDITKYNQYTERYGFWRHRTDPTSQKFRATYENFSMKFFGKRYKNTFVWIFNGIAFIKFNILNRIKGPFL